MADYIVSRVQERRGLQKDLPQPLRPGEIGWAMDTQRLFVGCAPHLMSPGFQVFPGNYTIVQSWLDAVKAVIPGPDFDLSKFADSVASGDTAPGGGLLNSPVKVVYGYSPLANLLLFLPNPDFAGDPLADPAYVEAEVQARTGALNPPASVGIPVFLDVTGSVAISWPDIPQGHEIAAAYASLLNQISDDSPLATVKLNVEILTEYSIASFLGTRRTSILPPQNTWTTINILQFSGLDSVQIEFSLAYDYAGQKLNETGTIVVTSNDTTANLTVDSARVQDALIGDIQFQATVNAGLLIIQYQSTLQEAATLKTLVKSWSTLHE